MAGCDQHIDRRLKRCPQLVLPKWNVFDHVMLSPDGRRYLPTLARRGRVKSKSEILLSRRPPRVDNVVYEELEPLKPTETRSFFTVPICCVLVIG
jgi:hypothetical protein